MRLGWVQWLGAWLWRRNRAHLALALWLQLSLAVCLLLQVPSAFVAVSFLDLSAGQAIAWCAIASAVTTASIGIVFLGSRDVLAPVGRWAAGDTSDPEAALAALMRLPPVLGQRGTAAMAIGNLVGTYPVGVSLADTGWSGTIGMALGGLYLAFTGGVFVAWGAQLVVREAADEVVEAAPRLLAFEVRGWSLRMRLVSLAACLIVLACISVAGIVLGGGATEEDYLATVLSAGLLGLYGAWVIDVGVVRPTLAPLFDVVDGTARVGRGDLATPVPVSSLDEIGDLASAFNRMQQGLAERAALHSAFGSYVDPTLAQRIVESGSAVFEGEALEVTVLFADVRDFTAFSESVSPDEAVAVLNRLFDVVVPAIRDQGGHANHYMGDGLLAVFGAPQPLEDHATAAVAAAIEMQRGVRSTFGHRIRLGIGINTGEVIAGTVGGGGRLEFTVIGDAVNVASRVEQLTKETGDAILITEATRHALSAPRQRTSKRGAHQLRGKAAETTVHAVNPFPRSTP